MYGSGLQNLKELTLKLSGVSENAIMSGGGLGFDEELNLAKLQGSLDFMQALTYRPMRGYRDKDMLFKVILAAVTWFIEGYKEGARMRTSDIYKFGMFLVEYQQDSLEDILLCFRLAENGELRDPETGESIRRYSSMDLELLKRYWMAYLDRKSELREQVRRLEKVSEYDNNERTWLDTKIIAADRPPEKEQEPRNMKDMLSEVAKGLDPFQKSRAKRLSDFKKEQK